MTYIEVYLKWGALAVEALKGLAWPISAGVIAYLLRSEIGGLSKRLLKVSALAATAEFAVPEEQRGRPPEVPDVEVYPATAAIRRRVEYLQERVAEQAPENRVNSLVHALAVSQLINQFHDAYHYIFGSQIRALRYLETHGRVSLEEIKQFFTAAVEDFPADAK